MLQETQTKVINVVPMDFKVLQHIKGAMKFSLEHSTLDAYEAERELYQSKLSNIVN